jgi:hypothetical protein
MVDMIAGITIGYTVTDPKQGHTVEALSADELSEDFPDMYWEADMALSGLFSRTTEPEWIVRAHWVLPVV